MSRPKILFCASVTYHFRLFHLPVFQWLQEEGWEVHTFSNGEETLPSVDRQYHMELERSPLTWKNARAAAELRRIMRREKYEIVHSHTPVGGLLARTAAAGLKETKSLYTAHGFHFCRGASWKAWVSYYPVEYVLSYVTDGLVTINQEDYQLADRRLRSGSLAYVAGVGVDTEQFYPGGMEERERERKKRGWGSEDYVLFYAAEYNENKNQQLLIRMLAFCGDEVKLVLAGPGEAASGRALAASLGVGHRVFFVGEQRDMRAWYITSDAVAASSRREGLPVNIMEAMACGLPVAALANRGHRELIEHETDGFIVPDEQPEAFAAVIQYLQQHPETAAACGAAARQKIVKQFSRPVVQKQLQAMYRPFMDREVSLRETDESTARPR
ncbi:glycosyltransferase family 4 protein [Alkalicoccus chagannorensis]|uniref:glycosyltransferase family 4 protein n=1 Tax=Alkalicoccus chagannorensis TaxID=427072 RepID=UPI0004210328|nr:glycosyltransferase family 4 protein [Alkalicoccus chagannorensis]